MSDYLWNEEKLVPIGYKMATGDLTLRRSVSCNLGHANIYYAYDELPYNYVVEIMQDRVWITDLPELLKFADVIGMQMSMEGTFGEIVDVLRHRTDVLHLIALLRSKEEDA